MATLSNGDRTIIDDTNIMSPVYLYEPVIASGGTNSEAIKLFGATVIGIGFPASVTGATMTVQVSFDDGSTWKDISGLTLSMDAGDAYNIVPGIEGWPMIRFVSDASEAADRTLQILVKFI